MPIQCTSLGKPKNATTISICLKVSDMFTAVLEDDNDHQIVEYNGYVPDFFPGVHYGDYVELDIDLTTGQIKNWREPTEEQIQVFINSVEDQY